MLLSLIVAFGVHSLRGFRALGGQCVAYEQYRTHSGDAYVISGRTFYPRHHPAGYGAGQYCPNAIYRQVGEQVVSPIVYLVILGIGLLVVTRGPEQTVRLRDDVIVLASDG
jgi:hypothetical protein